ncbi:MAG: prephenate dehydrogenase/arogenate dehydrogenase family protein [Lentisphaeria bacterium]|nr:prephenate dehydrogenase/arogenate dehydrogenase family protein [Lentisphaeria bacterium]
MRSAGIIGLGLLGGSLGMALKGAYRRIGWGRREENRSAALELDAVDEVFDDAAEVLKNSDIIVLAIPVQATIDFMAEYGDSFRQGAIVTDVGSLKGEICAAAEKFLTPKQVRFVGSHPMAGTEKRGVGAAFPTLYDNADIFILNGGGTDPEAVQAVKEMWQCAGGHPKFIADAHAHDALVARTSHVLHIVASALTSGILDSENAGEQALRFAGCATGFRDSCRIAASNPAMWREITEKNASAVLQAMNEFEERYFALRRLIENGDFDKFQDEFARGKELRDKWMDYKNNRS